MIEKAQKESSGTLTDDELNQIARDYIDDEILANINAGTNEYAELCAEEVAAFRSAIENKSEAKEEVTTNASGKANDKPGEYKAEADTGPKFNVEDDNDSYLITKKDVDAIQSMPEKSVNDFTSNDINKTKSFARRYSKELGVKSPFFRAWFGDWRMREETPIVVADKSGNARKLIKNSDTGWDIQISGKVFNETKKHNNKQSKEAVPYLDYINSIVENAILLDSYTIEKSKRKSENSAMMHSFYAVADIGNGRDVLKIFVEELNDVNSDGTIKRSYKLILPAAGARVQSNVPSPVTNTASNIKSVSDLFAFVKLFDPFFNPKPASMIVNNDGTPKVLYHQTENELTIFDTRHKGAGTRDNETPFGIFMKSLPENVGLNGDIQMPLYANIKNPLEASDRQYLVNKLRNILAEFGRLYDEHKNLDAEYQKRFDEATKQFKDYIVEWRKANPEASRTAIYDDEKFNELYEAEDVITEEWGNAAEQLELKTKKVITAVLRQNGYDGVYLKNDVGSFGRQTDAYIALDNTQVKSATDNIGTFDRSNPDIRFNLTSSGDYSTQEIIEAKALASDDSEFKLSVFIDSKREYDFGVLQGDIDSYVDNAYKK